MNTETSDQTLDFKTLTAIITANPDGIAILGAWNCMKTLAREDPEGCVRLMPGLSMDMAALAGFLRCPEALVKKTVSVFAKLRRLTVKDGLIRLPALGEEHNRNENQELCESNRPVLQKKAAAGAATAAGRISRRAKRCSPQARPTPERLPSTSADAERDGAEYLCSR